MEIEKIDPNFDFKTQIKRHDIVYYDITDNNNIDVYGLFEPKVKREYLFRLPPNKGIEYKLDYLVKCPAGGRIRFSTDSDFIGIRLECDPIQHGANISKIGMAGLDMYIDTDFGSRLASIFVPPAQICSGFESFLDFSAETDSQFHKIPGKVYSYTINLPLYQKVKGLKLILKKGALLNHGKKYEISKPIVFYGSSITQGAAASRPGCAYQSVISRSLDADFINLGFSGNAKGEKEVMEYIASLDMSAFVYDYDHNAPDVQHLKDTHSRGYEIIRNSHPDIPIIFISKPDFNTKLLSPVIFNEKRRDVVYSTYINAYKSGDSNVYFIDGSTFFTGNDFESMTSDGCHPVTYGFSKMAVQIGHTLKTAMFYKNC